MSDEPLASILAEMRDERIIRIEDADATRCLLRNLADRIEAAEERSKTTEPEKNTGNAAAMRAVLNSIADIAEDAFGGPWRHREASQGHALSLIIDAAKNALAAPARNCDRFADCNSAWKAYNAIADRERLPGFDFWLFEKVKEGGARRV